MGPESSCGRRATGADGTSCLIEPLRADPALRGPSLTSVPARTAMSASPATTLPPPTSRAGRCFHSSRGSGFSLPIPGQASRWRRLHCRDPALPRPGPAFRRGLRHCTRPSLTDESARPSADHGPGRLMPSPGRNHPIHTWPGRVARLGRHRNRLIKARRSEPGQRPHGSGPHECRSQGSGLHGRGPQGTRFSGKRFLRMQFSGARTL